MGKPETVVVEDSGGRRTTFTPSAEGTIEFPTQRRQTYQMKFAER